MENSRFRVMLEPRGFIRVIEFVLAIVAFATTGGYNDTSSGILKCSDSPQDPGKSFDVPVSYPFNFENEITVPKCNGTEYGTTTLQMTGNFSPTSQWFVFVGVMAFLICIASVIFYVGFETDIRAKNESLVTKVDLAVTVLWTLLWFTAAASWAWGVTQVKTYGTAAKAFQEAELCAEKGPKCTPTTSPNYGPLNASVAFAFLSVFVWAGNVWFVYKETPYHDDQTNLSPNEGQPSQEVPANQN